MRIKFITSGLSSQRRRVPIFKWGPKGVYLVLLVFFLFPSITDAQCAMCRAVVESDVDGSTAEGINNGIVYLMAIPYVLVGVLFYFVYKKLRS
ncbi:hypothetical protein [Flagellimonas myxillae]|uniref:hypothetical protein n=1 Tax=Flagellimonas myxillae TaxID=2942214 RepID=UPI0024C257D4